MAHSDRKDTFGSLGTEDMTVKELARELLAKLEPLIAGSANARSTLEESVRKQPLLAITLAAAAGFLLASFRRR